MSARYWIVERKRVHDGVSVGLRIAGDGPSYATSHSAITKFADEASASQLARWCEIHLSRFVNDTDFEQDCQVVAVA